MAGVGSRSTSAILRRTTADTPTGDKLFAVIEGSLVGGPSCFSARANSGPKRLAPALRGLPRFLRDTAIAAASRYSS